MDVETNTGGLMAAPRTLRVRRLIAAIAVAFAGLSNSGCVALSSMRATCSWLELVDEPALEITGLRATYGEEEPCTALKAPGQYRLRRADYTVEFWNGERWYPQFYVRVGGPDGRQLRLESHQFLDLGDGNTGIRPGVRAERGYFNYILRSEFRSPYRSPAERIEFTVLDASGNELGRESIRVVTKTGGEFRSFY